MTVTIALSSDRSGRLAAMARASLDRRFARLRTLDPNVRTLGFVSMLADLSSEIAYPLFPIFVTTVLGAPVALLGLIEGIAEATASITKYPFGQAADYTGRRKPFVLGGYTLGALGKLVIALSPGWATGPGRPLHRPARQGHAHGAARRPHRGEHAARPAGPRLRPAPHHGHDGRRARPAGRAGAGPGRRLAALDLRHRRDPGAAQRGRHRVPREGAPRGAAAPGVQALAPRLARPSAGCWSARCCSRSATPATRSSCSRPRTWA